MARMTRGTVMSLLVLVVAAACTSTGGYRTRSSSSDTLTRADLEASMQVNAFEAIRQSRPSWLRIRGANSINAENPIMVYVDGNRAGTIDVLQGIPLMSVERMKFYDPPEAQARFGLNNTNGAIEVITRRGT